MPLLSSTSSDVLFQTPLAIFFAQFEGFVYNPDNLAHHEFRRLCLCRCWTWDSPELKSAHDGFISASTAEYVYRIGIFTTNARAARVSQPPASNIPRFTETEIADSTTGPSEWQDYVDCSQDLLYCSGPLPESNETTTKYDSSSPASGVVIHPAEPSPSNKNANKVTSSHNTRAQSKSIAKFSGTNKKTEKHKTQSNASGISEEKKQTTTNDPNPLSDFFDQYPGFIHYPNMEPDSEIVICEAESPCNEQSNRMEEAETLFPSSVTVPKSTGSPTIHTTKKPKSRKKDHRKAKARKITVSGDPMLDFFTEYSWFDYHPERPVSNEFGRLLHIIASVFEPSDQERAQATTKYKDALTMQFNMYFGTNENEIEGWQSMCVLMQIDSLPQTLHQCKEIFDKTHVNLVDLVDAYRFSKQLGQRCIVPKFRTVVELSDYTNQLKRYFPQHNAYAGGLLKYLLRHIFHPSIDMAKEA